MFLSALAAEARRRQGHAGVPGPARGERPRGAGDGSGQLPVRASRRRRRRGASSSTTASFVGAPLAQPAFASNALLVGAKRSATGHPLFVAGPQVGYFFPEFFAEIDLEGGGFSARGALFPGVPFVVIGRGPDFSWSATSSQADNIDLFVETLCGGDDHHYLFRGQCIAMQRFDAGVLQANGQPDQPVSFYETTHGPVVGYGDGRRDEGGAHAAALDARPRAALGAGLLRSRHRRGDVAADVHQGDVARRVLVQLVLRRRQAHRVLLERPAAASARRGPIRRCRRSGRAPYEWQGFLRTAQHPQAIDPPSGVILNWNNKPAADVGAADSNFAVRLDLPRRSASPRRSPS